MATLYAKAAGGNWSAAGTWSNVSSAGGDSSGPPTAADNVILDAGSGNVTIDAASVCRSVNCTGYTGTLTHNATFTLSIGDATAGTGNIALKFVAGMTYTLGNNTTSAISFVSTSTTQQDIDFAGKTTGSVTFNGAGGTWKYTGTQVQASGVSNALNVTLTAGTLNTNGQNVTWGAFSTSGSTTRVLTLGASTITMVGIGTAWAINAITNLTLNANTSTISITTTGSAVTFTGSTLTYNNVSYTGTSNLTTSGASTFNNLTYAPVAQPGSLSFSMQTNITVSGILTVSNSNTATDAGRVFMNASIFAAGGSTPRTVTVNGSFSFSNVDFHFITAAGSAGGWTGTSMGDAKGNSNITFDSSRTLYWVGNAANWRTLARWHTTDGGLGPGDTTTTVPLPQDDCIINANSAVGASGTFSSSMRTLGKNVNFTGVPNNPAFALGGFNPGMTGSLTWGTGMTTSSSASATLTLLGSGTITHNSVKWALNTNLAINCANTSDSYTLQDAMDITASGVFNFTITAGGFDSNNNNITVNSMAGSGSNVRAVTLGTSTITLTGTGNFTYWTFTTATNLTFSGANSTIVFSQPASVTRTFSSGGSLTYGTITMTVAGSTGSLALNGNMTIGTLNFSDVTNARTLTLTAGNTVTVTTFNVNGTSGKLMTINSSSAGTQANLSKSSGAVLCDYLSIQDSHAQGGASWYAGANSTNVSGNTGWIFSAYPYWHYHKVNQSPQAVKRSNTY